MTTNPSPEFAAAQKKYLAAQSKEDQLVCLEEMIRTMPQHKSAESLRANLRTRYKKLQESLEKQKKSGKSTKQTIKKDAMQAIILGFPNSGKSSVFSSLTGITKTISANAYSTTEPELGTMDYDNCKIQIIDMPPLPNTDRSIINCTDTIVLIINSIDEIKKSEEFLAKSSAKRIIVFSKIDTFDNNAKRKIQETLKTKKYNFVMFSSVTNENLQELKKKIFETFPIIRIYLKEPKKPVTQIPMILKQDSNLKDVAEKILKGFSNKIKRARIWGPSSKFSGQTVGLDHKLKDKDIVEFQTI